MSQIETQIRQHYQKILTYLTPEDIANYCKDYIVSMENLSWQKSADGLEYTRIKNTSCKREINSRLLICQLP